MFPKRIPFIAILLLLALLFFPSTPALAQGEIVIDMCYLTDHFWDPTGYPTIDPTDPFFSGSPTLGGFGFTYNLMYVPEGTTINLNFDDQYDLETQVNSEGKAMLYYGLYNYGTYNYSSTYTLPDDTEIHTGPAGTVTINASEYLDCSFGSLSSSPIPPTITPEPTATPPADTPPTDTPPPPADEDIIQPTPTPRDNDERFVDPAATPFYLELSSFLFKSGYLLCCCLIFILAVLFGVIILIRRRRRRME